MKYLILFVHDSHWLDFKYAELDALLAMHSLDPAAVYSPEACNKSNIFLEVELENDEIARSVTARCVCIRAVYALLSGGKSLSGVLDDVGLHYRQFLHTYIESQEQWSMQVESYFGALTMDEKNYYRELMPFLAALGPVNVKNPSYVLTLLLNMSSKPNPKDHDAIPAYFGRLLCHEQMHKTIAKFDLKKRLYLGPTSLDHSLALIMANLAQARSGELVLDPFVGTASILVALAHFGCRCFGTDIDPRVLRGQMYAGKGECAPAQKNIFQNFKAYGLEPPELLRLDNHVSDRHYQSTPTGLFDMIVTDPPYGIRAGARKSGKKGGASYSIDADSRSDHVPSTQTYPVEEVMLDLLHTAARMLITGGRLLYLIPTTYDFEPSDLPLHPCLELVQMCEQPLSSRHGRRAVLMKKTKEYDSESEAQFAAYKREVMSGRDPGFGQLIHKLNRALAVNAYYDEDVVKRTSNTCARRKEARRLKRLQKEKSAASEAPTESDAGGDDNKSEINEATASSTDVAPVLSSEPITNIVAVPGVDVTADKTDSQAEIAVGNSKSTQVAPPDLPDTSKKQSSIPAAASSKGRLSPREPMDGGWYHNSLLVGVGAGFAIVALYSLLSAHFRRPR